jgi:hypothetical protein
MRHLWSVLALPPSLLLSILASCFFLLFGMYVYQCAQPEACHGPGHASLKACFPLLLLFPV